VPSSAEFKMDCLGDRNHHIRRSVVVSSAALTDPVGHAAGGVVKLAPQSKLRRPLRAPAPGHSCAAGAMLRGVVKCPSSRLTLTPGRWLLTTSQPSAVLEEESRGRKPECRL